MSFYTLYNLRPLLFIIFPNDFPKEVGANILLNFFCSGNFTLRSKKTGQNRLVQEDRMVKIYPKWSNMDQNQLKSVQISPA